MKAKCIIYCTDNRQYYVDSSYVHVVEMAIQTGWKGWIAPLYNDGDIHINLNNVVAIRPNQIEDDNE